MRDRSVASYVKELVRCAEAGNGRRLLGPASSAASAGRIPVRSIAGTSCVRRFVVVGHQPKYESSRCERASSASVSALPSLPERSLLSATIEKRSAAMASRSVWSSDGTRVNSLTFSLRRRAASR